MIFRIAKREPWRFTFHNRVYTGSCSQLVMVDNLSLTKVFHADKLNAPSLVEQQNLKLLFGILWPCLITAPALIYCESLRLLY